MPSVVLSEITYQANSTASIGDQQDVQQLSIVCGDLHYLIKATENSKIQILNLQTSFEREQKPTWSLGNALRLYVNILLVQQDLCREMKTLNMVVTA